MTTPDPLGLHAFVQSIAAGFASAAPVAAVGLIVIIALFGALRAGR